MRMLGAVLISALIVQSPAPPPQTGSASVSGHVFNSATNAPLSDVTVDLVPVLAPQSGSGIAGVPVQQRSAASRASTVTGTASAAARAWHARTSAAVATRPARQCSLAASSGDRDQRWLWLKLGDVHTF